MDDNGMSQYTKLAIGIVLIMLLLYGSVLTIMILLTNT